MIFDGLRVKPMFVLGDCQNKTKLTDLECVVKGTNYAEWLKVSASAGFCSAELPEPYHGNWSQDLEDLQKTELIAGEGLNLYNPNPVDYTMITREEPFSCIVVRWWRE